MEPELSKPPDRHNQAVPTNSAVTFRRLLMAVAVPLFGFAIYHMAHFDATTITGMAFTKDGRELMVFRGVKNKSRSFVDASCGIQVWDLATRRLSRGQITGHGELNVTQEGTYFFDHDQAGRIRVLDSATFKTLVSWQLPADLGKVTKMTATDHLLFVNSLAKDNTEHVQCFHLQQGQLIKQWSGGQMYHALSGNARRLFVSECKVRGGASTTYAYAIDGDDMSPLSVASSEGRTYKSDSAGNFLFQIMTGAKPQFKVRDLRTGSVQEWKPPAQLGLPEDLFITTDGRMPVFHKDIQMMAEYDAASGRLLKEQWIGMPSAPYSRILDNALSPDERFVAGTTDRQQVCLWDLQTGRIVARFPDDRPVRYGLTFAIGSWFLAWVVAGTRLSRPRPWFDLLLIHGSLIVLIVAYAVVRPVQGLEPLAIVTGFSVLIAIAGMLNVWWIHGGSRWSLRLAGLIGGLGTLAIVLLLSPFGSGVWTTILGALSFIAGLTLLLIMWRWRGFAISHRHQTPGDERPEPGRWQIPLADTFILTAAIGLFVGMMRFVVFGPNPLRGVTEVTALGTAAAVVVFVSTWAAFSSRNYVLRGAVAGVIVPTVGILATWYALQRQFGVMWWLFELVYILTALTVWLSLSVFRLHGYRLVRQPV